MGTLTGARRTTEPMELTAWSGACGACDQLSGAASGKDCSTCGQASGGATGDPWAAVVAWLSPGLSSCPVVGARVAAELPGCRGTAVDGARSSGAAPAAGRGEGWGASGGGATGGPVAVATPEASKDCIACLHSVSLFTSASSASFLFSRSATSARSSSRLSGGRSSPSVCGQLARTCDSRWQTMSSSLSNSGPSLPGKLPTLTCGAASSASLETPSRRSRASPAAGAESAAATPGAGAASSGVLWTSSCCEATPCPGASGAFCASATWAAWAARVVVGSPV
mmetsp:Transcript_32907/g.71804  ORF Transcript_32907/g.71804 Transcript_32907/m.71804 type:complete len:282 (+) Transcript_32907:580-1425(+)